MPLIFVVPLPPPVIRPKTRHELVRRKEYESLYSALLYARDPINTNKLNVAVEKAVEYGKFSCQDDSY